MSVCLCVCSQATGHSFWPRNLIFWHNTPWDMRKKAIFCFSKFWFLALWGPFFGHFRVFSSLSFVNLLYVLQVTPIDLQTWSLAQRVFMTPLRGIFNDFWKFAFLPLLGALLFSKRALKAKRHKCGHRDIISWYSGSMWQRNVGKQYYVWKFLILMS